jgi:hypothetical protein
MAMPAANIANVVSTTTVHPKRELADHFQIAAIFVHDQRYCLLFWLR